MKDLAWYEARFWRRVEKRDGCWIWTGGCRGKDSLRYGVAWNGERTVIVHRWAYEMRFGALAVGSEVTQHCGNRLCVRPEHLVVTSRADTMRHKVAKRQSTPVRGEQNPKAKLSDGDVLAIRERYATGACTQKALAVEFGVAQSVISKVIRGEVWKHVGGPHPPLKLESQSNTGYWGVSHCPARRGKRYQAWINAFGVRYALGFFATALEAAQARDIKALELLGPNATLNFPGEETNAKAT